MLRVTIALRRSRVCPHLLRTVCDGRLLCAERGQHRTADFSSRRTIHRSAAILPSGSGGRCCVRGVGCRRGSLRRSATFLCRTRTFGSCGTGPRCCAVRQGMECGCVAEKVRCACLRQTHARRPALVAWVDVKRPPLRRAGEEERASVSNRRPASREGRCDCRTAGCRRRIRFRVLGMATAALGILMERQCLPGLELIHDLEEILAVQATVKLREAVRPRTARTGTRRNNRKN